jgi:hypothetical protein
MTTPDNAGLVQLGYTIRRVQQGDGWGDPADDWILIKPDGLTAVSHSQGPLWQCAREHWRRTQLAAVAK